MKFKEKIIKLKEQNKGKIIIVRNGAFYIAIGNDAILLNKLLDLNCTCFAKGICKVGFPKKCIEKYSNKLRETGYGYYIYDYEDDEFILKEIYCRQSPKPKKVLKNIEERNNFDCKSCPKYKIFNF